MSKINVIIIFGGNSPEHDVSVITGLQIVENIDRNKYIPHAVLLTKDNQFLYYPNLINRKNYLKIKPKKVHFENTDGRPVMSFTSSFRKVEIIVDAAYLAFHGGNGESGQIQGYLEILDIPYTSSTVEGAAITMNKAVTRDILKANSIDVVKGIHILTHEIKENLETVSKKVTDELGLPVILKPAHLGSSIGINIAKTLVQLKKHLLEASFLDTEIVVEDLLSDFKEYNISVREVNGEIETSEIEKPLSQDEILSFADKYQRGGKKTGGMASLNRELPARISKQLRAELQQRAMHVYKVCRCKGLVRVDFMVADKGKIYVTEVNPIPGSMSYYLWEASGVSFTQQITDLIEQAIMDYKKTSGQRINYQSDIVEKFINNKRR